MQKAMQMAPAFVTNMWVSTFTCVADTATCQIMQ